MIDRRGFIGSLAALGSPQMLASLEAVESSPQGQLPGLRRLASLGKGRAEDEKFWERIRTFFYIPDDVHYLNNGSLGLSHSVVVEAMYAHLLLSESLREARYGTYPWWGYGPSIEIREKIASFIGADPDEIALTRNATEGMNTVATGLDLEPGDEVLLTNQEHPGGRSAWYQRAKRYGIAVREFRLPMPPKDDAEILNLLEAALTSRTRVISVSHITTVTGGMLPVKEISALARSRGIISLIDGAHAIGQLPIDMHDIGCDYYAASPHKWLFAPKGTGILYCRKGMAERLWCHTASGTWDKREMGCERLTNIGTSNYTLLVGMVAAMEFHRTLGIELVAERGRYLNVRLRETLAGVPGGWFMNGLPPALSTSMVKFALPVKKLGDFAERMWRDHKLWLTAADGDQDLPASIRFSLPVYIRSRDLSRAVEILRPEIAGMKQG